ncbi:hypothetical protein, partial [Tenacibaculum finnmarkense]
KNILTRSDMGVGDDALKAVTYRINDAFKGYAHRESYLEEAVKTLKVADCPDYKHRKGQKGTVVVIGGKGDHIKKYGSRDNVVYKTRVYRSMTLGQYKELKESDNLPLPDYVAFLTRDAHGQKSNYKAHSNNRYGQSNETPPGEYYLNYYKDSGGLSTTGYLMYLSDNMNNRAIATPDGGVRTGVAIHHWDRRGAIGCLTTASNNTILIKELRDEIPDLFIHLNLKNKTYTDKDEVAHNMSIERRPVRIVIEEREVIEEPYTHAKYPGGIRWEGFVPEDNQDNTN